MKTLYSERRSYSALIAFALGVVFSIWFLWFQSWALKGIRPEADLRNHVIIAEHFCMRRIQKLKIDFGLPTTSPENECRMLPMKQDVIAPLSYALTRGIRLTVKLKLNFLSPSEIDEAYILDYRPGKGQKVYLIP
jgi:hypothetical protein